MQEILSVSNDLIIRTAKLIQKKYRLLENKFLIEGEKCVRDAFLHNMEILNIFVLKDKISKYDFPNMILVNEKVMKKISTTENIPEIVAVCKIEEKDYNLNNFNKIAVFENIKDAGNLGTIIRSACAFGIDAIFLTGDCIDIYNPKVIRSSVGNIFKIPIIKIKKLDLLFNMLKGFTFYSTVVDKGKEINNINFDNKSAIFFGSEAFGISDNLKELVPHKITLPMKNDVESLNLAISASVIFWEIMKQTR